MRKLEDHPLEELSVRGDKLMRKHRLGPDTEYLANGAVQVKRSIEFHEMGPTEVLYKFELSEHPDATWLEIFTMLREQQSALVHGSELQLRCIPANLEGRYHQVKDVMAQTDRAYADHKLALLKHVSGLDAQRQQQTQSQAARSVVIRDQFRDLQL